MAGEILKSAFALSSLEARTEQRSTIGKRGNFAHHSSNRRNLLNIGAKIVRNCLERLNLLSSMFRLNIPKSSKLELTR